MRLALFATVLSALLSAQAPAPLVKLPAFAPGTGTLDAALQARRTSRSLSGPGLSLAQVSQVLWAAQGENRPGRRTVPSAHARYPLELYLTTQGSPTLPAGVYHYLPKEHALRKVDTRGPGELLGALKGMQPWIAASPAVVLVTGVPDRMAGSDPTRREAYTFWEGGAATQALILEAAALGLGSGVASGVDFPALHAALALPAAERPLVLIALGQPKP